MNKIDIKWNKSGRFAYLYTYTNKDGKVIRKYRKNKYKRRNYSNNIRTQKRTTYKRIAHDKRRSMVGKIKLIPIKVLTTTTTTPEKVKSIITVNQYINERTSKGLKYYRIDDNFENYKTYHTNKQYYDKLEYHKNNSRYFKQYNKAFTEIKSYHYYSLNDVNRAFESLIDRYGLRLPLDKKIFKIEVIKTKK